MKFGIRHLLMAQLTVGIAIPMYWLAEYCWQTHNWWLLFAFDCVILFVAMMVHCFSYAVKSGDVAEFRSRCRVKGNCPQVG